MAHSVYWLTIIIWAGIQAEIEKQSAVGYTTLAFAEHSVGNCSSEYSSKFIRTKAAVISAGCCYNPY